MAEKGFNLSKEIKINVPIETLWEMVGPGFVDVYKWSSNVDHATGKGQSKFDGAVCDERFCDLNVKGFSKISEKLTNYDENQKTLTYVVNNGMPSFVSKASNTWTVKAINSNQSKLIMAAEFKSRGIMGSLMNGMMKKKMSETLDTVLNDAKTYLETGEISEAKRKRKATISKKLGKVAA